MLVAGGVGAWRWVAFPAARGTAPAVSLPTVAIVRTDLIAREQICGVLLGYAAP